ncbi:MAG TPA: permease-like cell division protein FtsX [Gemmatimonadaceae bacterium]|nr:permease-like cell division protein FtsX [Gemmatimonadaceae bacterium]
MRLALREALIAFRRAPLLSLLSVVTIAFSLFAFGLFSLVALNIRNTLRTVEERVEIRAFLADGAPVDSIATTMETIGAFPEVLRVEYISPEQALERAREELGEFQDVFEASFLPASIDVRMREGSRDPLAVRRIADQIRVMGYVEDVRYGEDWIVKLHRIRNIATAAGIVLGAAFAAVSIIIIGATIRMTVLAREREISIMRLVGATDGFVRRPFLLEGFTKGVLGGVLALLLTWFANTLISRSFIETDFFPMRVALLGILAGALIGTLGSALSVGRHLRKVK